MLLKNCRVLPELAEGFEGQYADVLTEGDTIVKIAPANTLTHEGETMDLGGRTLLPGLIDLHVHFGVSGLDLLVDNAKSVPYRSFEAYQYALDTLRSGFTTVRDVGDVDHIVIEMRNMIRQGKLVGPTIYTSGKIVTPTEQENDYFMGMYNEADGVVAVRRAARQEFAAGADFMKIMVSGAISNPGGVPGMTICDEDELTELVRVAKSKGSYVAAHCHSAHSIKLCLKTGVRTIEHASDLDEEIIEELKKENTYIVPTLCCAIKIHESADNFSEFMRAKTNKLIESVYRSIKMAYAAGLKMGFGTDAGTTENWHGKNGEEFIYRYERAGIKPIDILKQATIESAVIGGFAHEVGTIKEGKKADFVVIDGKPEEDIYLMAQKPFAVIKSGSLVR